MRDSKIDVNSMLYGYYIQYQKLLELKEREEKEEIKP